MRDDFNGTTLNTGTWQVMTHTVGRSRFGNTPVVADGYARLRHDTYNPQSPGGQFRGTELAMNQFLSRGTLGIDMEARVRNNAMANGLVTSFFTYNFRTENGTGFWDEIDFEFLSNRVNSAPATGDPVLMTTFNDMNASAPPWNDEVHHSSREIYVNGLDLSQFQTVKMRWLPQRLEWWVNGKLYRTVTGSLVPTDATRLRFNFWAPASDWTAAYSSALQPTAVPANNVSHFYDVDWMAVRHARPAVSATAPNRVFTDRFNNGAVVNSDSVAGFWQTRNQGAGSSVTESANVPLKLTAGGAGFPHAQIASAVRSEFNLFESPIEIEATGLNFDSPSLSYDKSYLRFALSSQALSANTQSEYTSEDAFSLRVGSDNSLGLGFKVNAPNANTEFEGTNLLNQSVSGPVRRINLVLHPDFYTLKVEHDLSATDGTPTIAQFNGTLSLNLEDWKILSNLATGDSALYVQSQLSNAAANESTTAQLESLAVNAVRSNWSAGNGDWLNSANWQNGMAPNFRGANAVFSGGGATVTLNSNVTVGQLRFDSASTYAVGGTGAITLDTPARAARINVQNGDHSIGNALTAQRDVEVTIAANSTLTTGPVTLSSALTLMKLGGGAMEVAHVRGGNLDLKAGTLRITPSSAANSEDGASTIRSLVFAGGASAPTSRLDLVNNAMIVDYDVASPIDQIRQLLAAGITSGNGIVTTATTAGARIGYAEGSQLLPGGGTFAGQNVDATSVVLAYALAGDANLDRTVDIGDFSMLTANFNAAGAWSSGDFDYDGQTGIADFALLSANFNRTLSSARGSVPEPSVSLGTLGCGLLLRRRAKKR